MVIKPGKHRISYFFLLGRELALIAEIPDSVEDPHRLSGLLV
jgi:hypothetical protein